MFIAAVWSATGIWSSPAGFGRWYPALCITASAIGDHRHLRNLGAGLHGTECGLHPDLHCLGVQPTAFAIRLAPFDLQFGSLIPFPALARAILHGLVDLLLDLLWVCC
ncbi:hypothetical protein N1Z41_00035935 [Pseudomonas aeruginosa]